MAIRPDSNWLVEIFASEPDPAKVREKITSRPEFDAAIEAGTEAEKRQAEHPGRPGFMQGQAGLKAFLESLGGSVG